MVKKIFNKQHKFDRSVEFGKKVKIKYNVIKVQNDDGLDSGATELLIIIL